MKKPLFLAFRFFLLVLIEVAANGYCLSQARPIPRGIREAEQAEEQTQKNIPPPANPRKAVDPAKLQREADQLASLAQGVPSEVNDVRKGTLPKDLLDRLKQVEKLSKQLRRELTQ